MPTVGTSPTEGPNDQAHQIRTGIPDRYQPGGRVLRGTSSINAMTGAAIRPGIFGGNANAPVLMIAEKASDLIKEAQAKKGRPVGRPVKPYLKSAAYHQTSYCTPTMLVDVLPPVPKVLELAAAAASFQLA